MLFVELASGQNGTLTPYPSQGVGQTWLGADGATVTLDRGILKASRGLGDDLMGSTSFMPPWSKIDQKRNLIAENSFTGNNKIAELIFSCHVEKTSSKESIEIWDINFKVDQFEETCFDGDLNFKTLTTSISMELFEGPCNIMVIHLE